ncbi:MAG: CHAT domain-containing protein, partial [Bacteroidota bacterium]
YFFSEKSKAFNLYVHLKINEIEELGALPSGMLNRQNELDSKLSYYADQMAKARSTGDQTAVDRYTDKIKKAKEERDQVEQTLRSTNIDQYGLIHSTEIVALEDTRQSLSDNQVILSYNMGNKETSVIYLSKEQSKAVAVSDTENLEELLVRYQALLTNPDLDTQKLMEYKDVSFQLYQLLLGNLDLDESVNEILIIPDNRLYFLPFESLIRNKEGSSFGQLNYLIHSYDVRYAQSLTMMNYLKNKKNVNDELNVLALAPEFSNTAALPLLSSAERSSAGAIPNTKAEVGIISRVFDTKVLENDEATEQQFKSMYTDYQIIHLATHGLVNDRQPLESKILFQQIEGDSIDDGKLHSREILDLQMDAEMVVLSACNTGVGEINRGEGAVSLASSFFYSGARSVVLSQWPANDLSTSKIMGSFYQYLDQGLSKSAALRQAKLDYLQSEKEFVLHPYYWSQFVLHGKNDPLKWKMSDQLMLVIGLVSILLIVVAAIVIRQKMKPTMG